MGGWGRASQQGGKARRGNATEPLRGGGAHTTLGDGLYAIMPRGRGGGGHSCAVQPGVPVR